MGLYLGMKSWRFDHGRAQRCERVQDIFHIVLVQRDEYVLDGIVHGGHSIVLDDE
jgi:hypothetical protein